MTETSGSLPSDFSVVMDLGSFYFPSSEVSQVTGQGETRKTSVGPPDSRYFFFPVSVCFSRTLVSVDPPLY